MAEVAIGKLTLQLPAAGAKEPAELAARVARQLAQMALPPVSQDLGGLQITLNAVKGEDDDSLAGRIAGQILRQLNALS